MSRVGANADFTIRVGARNDTKGVFAAVSRDIQQLKKTVGSHSDFGQLMAIAKGGGAVAGITMLVRSVGELATAFNRAKEEGKGFFETMQEGLAKIPIAGTFIEAGAAINELITGDQAYKRRLEQKAAENQKRLDEGQKRREALAKVTSEAELEKALKSVLPAGVNNIEQLRNFIKADELFLSGNLPIPAGQPGADQFNKGLEKRKERLNEYRKLLELIEATQARIANIPFLPQDATDPLLEAILKYGKAEPGGRFGSPIPGFTGGQLAELFAFADARRNAAGTLADLLEQQLAQTASRGAALREAAFSSGLQSRGIMGVRADGLTMGGSGSNEIKEAIKQLRDMAKRQADAVDVNTRALQQLAEQYRRLLTPQTVERIFN